MANIPDKIKENVRAVLLSKTDGKGVLVNDFLRDYKSILREPLMFSSLGYSNLPEFLKAIPDVCRYLTENLSRLEYYENIMAFKLFGIAKPNTYASSWHKKAEGNVSEDDSEERQRKPKRDKGGKGELLNLGTELDEDWEPNCRGLYSLCFPNKIRSLSTVEAVTVKFSAAGPVAEVNIIPKMVFIRYRDSNSAKKAMALWGDELRIRRAEERPPRNAKNAGSKSKESKETENDLIVKPSMGEKTNLDENEMHALQNGYSAGEKYGYSSDDRRKHSGDDKKGYSADEKRGCSAGDKKGYSADVQKDIAREKKDIVVPIATRNENDGLLGRAPGDPGLGIINGLLEGPLNTLYVNPINAVGRASALNYQMVSPASHVISGPISRPVIGTMSQPVPNQISPQEFERVKDANHKGGKKEGGDKCYSCGETGHFQRECPVKDEQGKRVQVYIGNFPYTANKRDLENLVTGYQYIDCRLLGDRKNDVKKYAFVVFATMKEAERCIKDLNETQLQGRTLRFRLGDRNVEQRENDVEGGLEVGVKNVNLSPKPSMPSQDIHQLVQHLSPKPNVPSENMNLSPKPKLTSPVMRVSPKISPHSPSVKPVEEDEDDEMPPLEENFPVIRRTVVNDQFEAKDKRTGRQPGSYVPKGQDESPVKMPPLETLSPQMPELETSTPKPKPLIPVPEMPKPDESLNVFDSRELEEEMLQDSSDESDQSVQLFISNFPYGTRERELLDLFEKQGVEQIVIMNNSITNRSTYAFVTVSSIEQAQLAILQHDQALMKGRRLTVGMATLAPNSKKMKARQADPIARITCTVGASGDSGSRHVSVGDAYSLPSPNSSTKNETSINIPDRSSISVADRNPKLRLTQTLKTYAVIVSKLHGEIDFQLPLHSRIKVFVTHVEEDGQFFWGHVLIDENLGVRKNLETLQRISVELQDESCRPGKVKEGKLGRCAAMYEGEWYRAWNTYLTEDGMHDIFYVDYGNKAMLSSAEVSSTLSTIWSLPPMAKPFRLMEAGRSFVETGRGKTMTGLDNQPVVLEIVAPGNPQSNFVATVRLLPDEAMS